MSGSLIELLLTKTSPLVAKIYSMKAGAPVVEEAPDPKQRKGGKPPAKGIWAKFSV